MQSKILSQKDINSIVSQVGLNELLDELISRLRTAFTELSAKNVQIPTRTGIHYSNPDLGLLEWMPASIDEGQASLKIVGYHPSNPIKRDLPTILSSIGIFDTQTGHLQCLLDGTFATALRTGAMSAIASELMTRSKSSITLGVIGCGAQAVTQIHSLSRLFEIERIIAYDTNSYASKSLSDRVAFTGIQVESVSESNVVSTLLEKADILCTCTSADPGSGPLFKDFANKPHLHINAVGSDFPTKIELPINLLRRSFVCPDFKEQAMAEGECQKLLEHEISTDITGLLNSRALQQTAKDGLSVFDSTGHAYADYMTGLMFHAFATDMGLGTEIEIESEPPDPIDPYSFLSKPAATCGSSPAKHAIRPISTASSR
ncbi:ornithine cyclodeaminase family protein [Pelagicoccus sp. SDUM812002]|uniref:ornithine cyclodeaminase family protein n=1 Tax=Pelagicoccus sp. SDUM812002 TaxID=3041266 RepID=UPI00280E9258|nr:ornithine cyclodeaminase family protein [Pelagicoccus sp. SDUM812002]MDQ8185699.1 ornithine cyclodeaminase family protein [Pelagicoccus sp. SDUM812002]